MRTIPTCWTIACRVDHNVPSQYRRIKLTQMSLTVARLRIGRQVPLGSRRKLLTQTQARMNTGMERAGDWERLTSLVALGLAHCWMAGPLPNGKLLKLLTRLHLQVPHCVCLRLWLMSSVWTVILCNFNICHYVPEAACCATTTVAELICVFAGAAAADLLRGRGVAGTAALPAAAAASSGPAASGLPAAAPCAAGAVPGSCY